MRHRSNSNVLLQLTEVSAESRAVLTDSDLEIGRLTAEFNQLSLNDTLDLRRRLYTLGLLTTTPPGAYSASLTRMMTGATTEVVPDMGLDCLRRLSVHYTGHTKTTINSPAGREVSSISVRDVGAIINCRKTQNKARSLRK